MSSWLFGGPPRLRSGQPVPLGPEQQRDPPFRPFPASPMPTYMHHPQPSVGADALSYQGHLQQLSYDPIGAGVVVAYPFRPVGQMPAQYQLGTLIFSIQQVNYGRQPQPGGPLWTPGQLAAIMGDYKLAEAMTPAQANGIGTSRNLRNR